MKKLLIGISVLCLLSALVSSASAALVTFDFTGSNASSLSGNKISQMTQDGWILQIESWTANHNTTGSWTTTNLAGSTITHSEGSGLGVNNTSATGSNDELDTGIYNSPNGWQDFLSFKIVNLASGTVNYHSITYSGLDKWISDAEGEFAQTRINTRSGGVVDNPKGELPLGTWQSRDHKGLEGDPDTFLLPAEFKDGIYYLLAGPRLGGINNSGTAGALDSFRVASVTLAIDGTAVPIPAAAWLLGTGIIGLAALRRKVKK